MGKTRSPANSPQHTRLISFSVGAGPRTRAGQRDNSEFICLSPGFLRFFTSSIPKPMGGRADPLRHGAAKAIVGPKVDNCKSKEVRKRVTWLGIGSRTLESQFSPPCPRLRHRCA